MSNKKPESISKKNKLPIIIGASVLGVALIGGAIFAAIKLFGKNTDEADYTIPDDYIVEYPDVEKYFNENSTVLEVIPVNKSKDVFNEEDATDLLESRGFIEYEITSSYTMDGVYDDPVEVSDSSKDKHPIYETYYVSTNQELWTINIVDGVICAYPVSYVAAHPENVPVMVSESEEIISYDSSTNSFYKTIPNDNVLDVRVVNKIDAETLDSLTVEELAND